MMHELEPQNQILFEYKVGTLPRCSVTAENAEIVPEDANADADGWRPYRVPVLCHLLEAQHLTDVH